MSKFKYIYQIENLLHVGKIHDIRRYYLLFTQYHTIEIENWFAISEKTTEKYFLYKNFFFCKFFYKNRFLYLKCFDDEPKYIVTFYHFLLYSVKKNLYVPADF